MSEQPYMQLWIADYLGDTQHLTAEQHGAYLLLLMSMWRAGGYLPNSPAMLRRIARIQGGRWGKVWESLREFFIEEGSQITQGRLLCELTLARKKSEQRRLAGEIGGRSNSLKNKKRRVANGQAKSKQTDKQNGTIYQSQLDTNVSNKKQTPLQTLLTVLDASRAEAVVEHRKAIRKPLTAHSAKLLVGDLGEFSDPGKAADEMMLRGWLTNKREWGRGGAPPKAAAGLGGALDRIVEKARRHDERDSETGNVVDLPVNRNRG